MNRLLLLFFSLFTFLNFSFGRHKVFFNSKEFSQSTDTAIIRGIVRGSEGAPATAVAVVLCEPDSSIINTTITDSLGRYQFKNVPYKNYLLLFRHIAYKQATLYLDKKQLETTSKPFITFLENRAIELRDVLITDKKKAPIQKIQGGFAFQLDDRLSNTSLLEALKLTPLLNVHDNGTIGILGKKGSAVYINGKMVQLGGNELLQLLQNQNAQNVKSIEILSSPPSNYDAQGNAGVINIVLKKTREEGLSGSVSVTGERAVFRRQLTNVNLNYARGKFTSQLGLRGAITKNRIIEDSQNFLESINQYNQSTLNRKERGYPCGASLSSNIAISKTNLLSFQSGYSYSSQKLLWQTQNDYSTIGSSDVFDTNLTTVDQHVANSFFNIDISDKIQFDTAGHKTLTLATSYFTQNNENNAPYFFTGTISTNNFKTGAVQKVSNFAAKADFRKKLKSNAEVSVGAKVSFSESLSRNQFFNEGNGSFINNSSLENNFNYKEKIFSAYSMLQMGISKKLQANIGFRLENTIIDGRERIRDSILTRNFLNFFPNASLTYTVNTRDKLSFDVSNRITRPGFWELNPTPIFIAPTRYSEGNAFLLPSIARNFELSYILGNSLVFVVGYSSVKRDFMQFLEARPGSDTLLYTRYNYGNNKILNFNGNFNKVFFKEKVRISTNLNVSYNNFSGAVPNRVISLKSWQALSQSRVNYLFGPKSQNSFYTSYNYYSPFKNAQGKDLSLQFFEVGFNTKYKELSAQVRYIDPFETGLNRFSTNIPSMLFSRTSIDPSRTRLVLTLNYRFGSKVARKAKAVDSANEEQKNRKL